MEMYQEAYEQYRLKCRLYGVSPIDLIDFIQTVTKEQAKLMIKSLN
ncbi:hypothetical protein [Halalkalibacter akibai]|nr:hypothetical protein [Halalkalibacter akibai]